LVSFTNKVNIPFTPYYFRDRIFPNLLGRYRLFPLVSSNPNILVSLGVIPPSIILADNSSNIFIRMGLGSKIANDWAPLRSGIPNQQIPALKLILSG
jgi:hypothetical protein